MEPTGLDVVCAIENNVVGTLLPEQALEQRAEILVRRANHREVSTRGVAPKRYPRLGRRRRRRRIRRFHGVPNGTEVQRFVVAVVSELENVGIVACHGHRTNLQIDLEGRPQLAALHLQQAQQGFSQRVAHSNDPHPDHRVGQPKGGVERPEGPGRLRRGHHDGNVSLGAPLRNGENVDLGVSQGRKEPAGNARDVLHPVPDGRHDAAWHIDLDVGNPILFEFLLEFFLDGLPGLGGVLLGRCKGDAVFRRSLRDQHDVDAQALELAKEPPGNTLDTDQARSLHVDECHVLDARKATHARVGLGLGDAGSKDPRSAKLGIEGVSNENGNLWVAGDCRLHRFWVDHLRSKVG
mmetsp:Transcript_20552/g.57023  ORF Transcript_20552/g.57023 Transcript_20552/m.57023 type:complete len:351 (-) Transcript_20552:1233-2285(-)